MTPPTPPPTAATPAAAVGLGNALVAQIEREISQLDGEIEELKGQLSRAATRRDKPNHPASVHSLRQH